LVDYNALPYGNPRNVATVTCPPHWQGSTL